MITDRAIDAMAAELAAKLDTQPLTTFKDDEWRPWSRKHEQLTLESELSVADMRNALWSYGWHRAADDAPDAEIPTLYAEMCAQ